MSRSTTVETLSPKVWVPWIAASVASMVALTSFCYLTFETKDEAHQAQEARDRYEEAMIKRLDRIEDKLDRLIQHK